MAYLDFFVRQLKRAKVRGSQIVRKLVLIQIVNMNCHQYWNDEAILISTRHEVVQVVIIR